eukprot:CAMPEP_0185614974 /NCGR_PEP_ID=MMETSP0436-20130131/33958_1 /TAXON_ID=626734 ORGANISM="Favella taraikaensis, Strain Fe Narragansett Bay" /NCGR_SAMPLE_ID=MMETSP0436 /ASSEMBLY_ACC=CAM_ASM_000390 /LENGTH=43 /DNA_ID= /DNA_START= /DNA_END= /DNA_ORIENTATION=
MLVLGRWGACELITRDSATPAPPMGRSSSLEAAGTFMPAPNFP